MTQLTDATAVFPLTQLGVGLEMVNASTGERLPMDEVIYRFDAIEAAGIREV